MAMARESMRARALTTHHGAKPAFSFRVHGLQGYDPQGHRLRACRRRGNGTQEYGLRGIDLPGHDLLRFVDRSDNTGTVALCLKVYSEKCAATLAYAQSHSR